MIKTSQTFILQCDHDKCDEEEVFVGLLPVNASQETILDAFLYEKRYCSEWHIKNGKLLHSHIEDEDV